MKVDLLIGSDQYWDLVIGETHRGVAGPVAFHTRFGWGPLSQVPTSSSLPYASTACLVTHTMHVDGQTQNSLMLEERLKSFRELECFGVVEGAECSIHFMDGRYEVQLPWKKNHPMLPDNYQLGLKWLRSLGRQLKLDPAILR